MSGTVPITKRLDEIYTDDTLTKEEARWDSVVQGFKKQYEHRPDFVARSPGRVNIIGEHIDYSLYAVLPMAITADVIVAVSTKQDQCGASSSSAFRVRIANSNSSKYPSQVLELEANSVEIDGNSHEWTNYFKSGLRCALQILQEKHGSDFKPKSMQVLVNGTVPAGSGLSSSTALTTASALSVLFANGEREIDKAQLTELAIVSERAAGVNSGGMDQSASVFSVRGSALFVSFYPSLTAKPVEFPKTSPELKFVVAQSFVVSDKSLSGPVCYNLRVVECTLAAAYLNAKLDRAKHLPSDNAPLGISLRGFHNSHLPNSTKPVEDQLNEIIQLTKATLTQEEGYTREEIASTLQISTEDLNNLYTSKFPVRAERFKLRQRALHVFTEALRVLQFYDLILNGPLSLPEQDTATYNQKLGEVLNAAQRSAKEVYECSCPELDQIIEIARRAGSYGSRLTGAGWGGCSVHLVPADKVDAVKGALEGEYYSKIDLSEEQKSAAVVVSKPGSGSIIFTLDEDA